MLIVWHANAFQVTFYLSLISTSICLQLPTWQYFICIIFLIKEILVIYSQSQPEQTLMLARALNSLLFMDACKMAKLKFLLLTCTVPSAFNLKMNEIALKCREPSPGHMQMNTCT